MSTYASVLTAAHRNFLASLFPGDNCLLEPEDMLVYATDASLRFGKPLAVVRPATVEQVRELFRWADAERMPLYMRGRGTTLAGCCIPDPPGVVVSTMAMKRILEVSADDFVAVAEPGVNTVDFQNRCEADGLFYPPDPASQNATTIGGNVATCAGGMRALKYGVTRDFVLGMDVVLPGGDLLTLGGRSHKNVVGLDLTRLLVGSEGTLGFITQMTLKLLPLPEATASLLAGFSSLEAAMSALRGVFALGILPTALEFLGEAVLNCMQRLAPVPWPGEVKAALLFKLDGSHAALPLELERLQKALPAAVWSMRGIGKEEEEELWAIRRRINPSTFILGPDKITDDVAVPRGAILKAVQAYEKIADEHKTSLLTFGHVGDGNIHVNLIYDGASEEESARAKAAKLAINMATLSLGGTMSGEHGIGVTKDITLQVGPKELALMRRVKAAFDPNGILNPHKAY